MINDIDDAEARIVELEVEVEEQAKQLEALNKAAQAVVDNRTDESVSGWHPELDIAIDALAALLPQQGESHL